MNKYIKFKNINLIRLDFLLIAILILLTSGFLIFRELGIPTQFPIFNPNQINAENDILITDITAHKSSKIIYFSYKGKIYHSPCYEKNNRELFEICRINKKELNKKENSIFIKNAVFVKPFSTGRSALLVEGILIQNKNTIPFFIDVDRRNSYTKYCHIDMITAFILFYFSIFYIILCVIVIRKSTFS